MAGAMQDRLANVRRDRNVRAGIIEATKTQLARGYDRASYPVAKEFSSHRKAAIIMTTPALSIPKGANPLRGLADFGQSVWLDYIRRSLITSGELKRLVVEDGLRGVTSNPAIFEKAIVGSTDYVAVIESAEWPS